MLGFKAHYLLKKNECTLEYNDIINNNKKCIFQWINKNDLK